jgi:hypothetical protein
MILSSVLYLMRRHGVEAKLVNGKNRITIMAVFVDNVWRKLDDPTTKMQVNRVVIRNDDLAPIEGDQIVYRERAHEIKSVRPVVDSGNVVAYVCEAA